MKRRDFLKATSVTAASLTLGGCFETVNSISTKNDSRPNLLVIHTDEHNFRTLGCYRKLMSTDQAFVWGKDIAVETPNIDWIAEHGAICTSFYATTPVCSPSRSSFFSGKYPQNTPVVTNDVPLNDNIITFAEVLRSKGYATGYAGKWHLDGTGKPQWAPKRQFGFADNRYMFNRGHWKKLEDTPDGPRVAARIDKGKPAYDVNGADEKSFTTDFLADKTVDFINTHKQKPFCYVVSIPDPHGPNTVRAPYDTMYDHLKFELPKTAKKSKQGLPGWAKKNDDKKMKLILMSKYFGMVKCIDDNVGKILKTLRDNDLIKNTIIVFTADHGDMCFEHGRHNKGIPLESSAKIPFVIHCPAKIKPSTIISEALSCVDFMPTILPLMGQNRIGTEEGRDCSELFVSGKAPDDWKDVAFIRGTGNTLKNWFGAVTKRHKLIYAADEEPWLYDLRNDPDELINYYRKPEYKHVVQTLSHALIEYGRKYNDPRVMQNESLMILRET